MHRPRVRLLALGLAAAAGRAVVCLIVVVLRVLRLQLRVVAEVDAARLAGADVDDSTAIAALEDENQRLAAASFRARRQR
eukprot:6304654-Prymnesium_polylepis.1